MRRPRMFSRSALMVSPLLVGLLLVATLADHAGAAGKANPAKAAGALAAKTPDPAVARGAVYTLDADRFDGPILSLVGGQLAIDSDPPRTVALDEVDHIDLGAAPAVLLVWVGQDNHDGVQAGSTAGTSGIQDIHVQIRGVAPVRKITQVVMSGVFAGAAQVWMLDPGNTPFWRLESVRAADSSTADLYFEPPTVDCFEQPLDVMLTFDDKTTVKSRITATTHTDASLKVGKVEGEAKAAAAIEPLVVLATDERVHGRSVEIGDDHLRLKLLTGPELKIPLAEVRGVWLGDDKSEHRKTFDEKLKKAGASDWALIASRENEKEVASVEGSVQAIADGKLVFQVGDDARKVSLPRVLGLVMAAHPAHTRPDVFYQMFELAGGDKISGQMSAIKPDVLDVHTLWGTDVQLPRGEVRSITCRDGRATYLSDLEPVSVDEISYFEHRQLYHRDQGLTGGPLLLQGMTYRKGLAVHSRCVLTYRLDGRYERFKARLGFEDGAPLGGSIVCRVLADDRELYANPAVRPAAQPVSLNLELQGAKQLVLEVDFGDSQDVGDRVVWAAARVVRPESAQPAASAVPAAAVSAITNP